jgi:hypothetical protein
MANSRAAVALRKARPSTGLAPTPGVGDWENVFAEFIRAKASAENIGYSGGAP